MCSFLWVSYVSYQRKGKDVSKLSTINSLFEQLNQYMIIGDESYENYKKHAGDVFDQLNELQENGLEIEGDLHKIVIVHSSDWKAAACIDGEYM